MTEREAVETVEGQRAGLEIDPEMRLLSGEQVIVEWKKDRETPGPTEDRIAWVLHYACNWGFVEVHVDDASGKILHIVRSA